MDQQNNTQEPSEQPENEFNPEFEAPTTNGNTPEQPVNVPPMQTVTPKPPVEPSEPAPQPQAEPAAPATPFTQQSAPTAEPTVFAPISSEPPVVFAAKPKSKKKWLVPVVALAIVLLAGGGASAYYFAVYQRPENVLLDAYNKITAAQAIQSDSMITLNKNLSTDLTLKDVKFKANSAAHVNGMLDASIDMEYKGKALPVGGKAMISLADRTVYFQVNNVKQAISTVLDAEKLTSQMPAGFIEGLAPLQDQWVKVTIDDMKKTNQAAGSDMECIANVIQKHTSDSNKETVDSFKKNPFIVVKQDLGVKDGQISYKMGWDQTKAKQFATDMQNTALYKDIKACNLGGSTSDSTPSVDSAASDNSVYTVWVDQWSHELRKIEVNGDSGTGSNKLTYTGTVNFAYDSKVGVAAPSGSITLEEYVKRYDDFAKKFDMPTSSSLESSYPTTGSDVTNNL